MGHHAFLPRWLLVTFATFSTAMNLDECNVAKCLSSYTGSSCDNVAEVRSCLSRLPKECSDDIRYRGTLSSLNKLNCSDAAPVQKSPPSSTKETCLWRSGEHAEGWRHCSLYGDPHLRTFEGELQTCRAVGAWPLVDNAYVVVQVTNSPVGRRATVLSKVTVLIRAHGNCAMEKHYEVQIKDNPLPSVFVDGTTSAGEGVLLAPLGPNRVQITLNHAGTRLIIGRQGDFLSVTLRLPLALVGQPQSQELCLRGCPSWERLTAPEGEPAWRLSEADTACRGVNLTGAYLDACVFDVLATGQKDMAAEASAAAVADLKELGATTAYRAVQEPSGATGQQASATVVVSCLLLLAWLRARGWTEPQEAVS